MINIIVSDGLDKISVRTVWVYVQQKGHTEGPHQREARGPEVRGSQ